MKKLYAFCLIFLGYYNVSAQINASIEEGCAPLSAVEFNTDYTDPQNITWDFDDGGGANIPDPIHTFINPGVYNVTFSAEVDGQQVDESITITVYSNPVANLSGEIGCVGDEIQFTDLSESSSSQIENWEWTFGDGNFLSGTQNPVHTYNFPGEFNIGLIVTDLNGCNGAIILDDEVIIGANPSLSINYLPSLFSCTAPHEIEIQVLAESNSPLTDELTFEWDFGNGNTSNSGNPENQIYTSEGTFAIEAMVTDDQGCFTSQTNSVVIQDPEALFEIIGGEDGVICATNQINNLSGIYPALFNFGDGQGDTLIQDSSFIYFFEEPGFYDISMNVQSGFCSDNSSQTFEVQIPEFDISGTPSLICEVPGEIEIEITGNAEVDNVIWSYTNFVDTVTTVNGIHTASIIFSDSLEYTINGYLPLSIIANITSIEGCSSTSVLIDSLWPPNALPMANINSGCAPLTITYFDESTTHPGSEIINWEWNINGDTFPSNQGESISYTFDEPGIYEAQLIIENSLGCVDTSYIDSIFVGDVLPIDFSFDPSPLCVNDSITFSELSGNENIEYWNYSGDNSTLSGCFLDGTQTMVFNNSTGSQTVTLSAIYNGCESTVEQQIEVLGAIGWLSYDCNCETPLDYVFNADVQNASSWDIDFGDGNSLIGLTQTQFTHSYTTSGNYNAVLTSYSDDGCQPYIDTLLVKVRQLEGEILGDTLLCAGFNHEFTVLATDNKTTCNRGYHMFWGDQKPPDINPTGDFTHNYDTTGVFSIIAAIIDDNGCRDTLSRDIKVFKLDAEVSPFEVSGCLPLDVTFTDISVSDTTIVEYNWDFNDSTEYVGGPTEIHQFNIPVLLNEEMEILPWQVVLTITDAVGCLDTDTIPVFPTIPEEVTPLASDFSVCVGDSIDFSVTPNNPGWTYEWEIGSFTSNESSPSFQFNNPETLDLNFTAIDPEGCPVVVFEPDAVSIQNYPEAFITSTADELDVLCYPLQATFNNATDYNGAEPGNIFWDLDSDSPVAPIDTVGYTYDTPGTYEISMAISSSNGCSDFAFDTLIVVGPVAELTTDLNTICKGDSILFTMNDTTDVWTWQWDFGDGQVLDGINFETEEEANPVSHGFNFIPENGEIISSLTVWSLDSVCSASYQETINIHEVIADFEINGLASDTEHCDDVLTTLNNTSSGSDIFFWDLDVEGNSTQENPSILDYPPGDYEISLIAESSEIGCLDTIIRFLTVHPLPVVTANDGLICLGDSFQLLAEGASIYSWTPNSTLDNGEIQNPIATPEFTTIYTVLGTDTNNCMASALGEVVVFQNLPDFDLDSTIVIGESVSINLPPGTDGYNYIWTPEDWVDCVTCGNTILQPLEDTQYSILVNDSLGCFENKYSVFIEVLPLSSVAVPDVFTPNGDNVNDIIYVEGWGIKELLTFQIFNRWGEMVFETSDINEGWDGTYKGEPQNMETYSYIARVETYVDEEPLELYGMIMLKR